MKGHKAHHHAHGGKAHHAHGGMAHAMKHRAKGGKAESPEHGVNEAEMDLHDHPMEYNKGKPEDEAMATSEKKHGGRAKRKHGGMVHKHVAMHGEHGHHHAGRKPRKSGGRAGAAEMHPFTTAHAGTAPKGRKIEKMTMGSDI